MNHLSFSLKNGFGYLIRVIGTLIICIMIGALLMLLIYRVPVNKEFKANAVAVLDDQNTSADYPIIHSWEQYFTSFRPGVFDGNSTTIIVNNCYSEINDNYLQNSVMPEYSRYWHGYVVLWRPLLYILEYHERYLQLHVEHEVKYLLLL